MHAVNFQQRAAQARVIHAQNDRAIWRASEIQIGGGGDDES